MDQNLGHLWDRKKLQKEGVLEIYLGDHLSFLPGTKLKIHSARLQKAQEETSVREEVGCKLNGDSGNHTLLAHIGLPTRENGKISLNTVDINLKPRKVTPQK